MQAIDPSPCPQRRRRLPRLFTYGPAGRASYDRVEASSDDPAEKRPYRNGHVFGDSLLGGRPVSGVGAGPTLVRLQGTAPGRLARSRRWNVH